MKNIESIRKMIDANSVSSLCTALNKLCDEMERLTHRVSDLEGKVYSLPKTGKEAF